jgi:hypothetical protein
MQSSQIASSQPAEQIKWPDWPGGLRTVMLTDYNRCLLLAHLLTPELPQGRREDLESHVDHQAKGKP